MRSSRLVIEHILCAAFAVGLVIAATCERAFAQCAMCRAVAANAEDAAQFAKLLNLGILVLLIPPVIIFCGIFVLAFKHRSSERVATAVYETPETGVWRRVRG